MDVAGQLACPLPILGKYYDAVGQSASTAMMTHDKDSGEFMTSICRMLLVPLLLALAGCISNPLAGDDNDAAAEVVAARQAPDDGPLAAAVRSELQQDPQLAGASIDVSASQGVITLSGSVPSSLAYLRAISVARQVPGVRPPVKAPDLTYPRN